MGAITPLAACTSPIDLSQLEPLASSVVACSGAQGQPTPALAPASVDLNFSTLVNAVTMRGPGAVPMATVAPAPASFQAYAEAVMAKKNLLPAELRADPVVDTVFRLMIKSSSNAHVNAQVALAAGSGATIPQYQVDEVRNYPVPAGISYADLKAFSKSMFYSGLKQTVPVSTASMITPAAQTSAQNANNIFSTYFTAYYSGKFYDRLGQSISKPTISLTVSDAEIAGALSFLIEYTVDLIDPTPVLGTDPTPVDPPGVGAAPAAATQGTTYYPGNNTNKPTVLTAYGNSIYMQIPASSTCGWNKVNAASLGYVASAAGDEAGAASGLVSGSFGGIEIGLGVLGKLSLGDNQTLATLVKTAASRLAERATLAATYWAFKSPTAAGAPSPSVASPTASYNR